MLMCYLNYSGKKCGDTESKMQVVSGMWSSGKGPGGFLSAMVKLTLCLVIGWIQ